MTSPEPRPLPIIKRLIEIADYDPAWPALFEAERARLVSAVGASALIEHIGSTSVPGLAAKPVIDIMIGLPALADAAACLEPVQALGYTYVSEFEHWMPERRYFRRDTDGARSHQIHMVEADTPFWARHLAFRDYLRAHPDARDEYAALKRELAARHVDDMGAYTDDKSAFIQRIEALTGNNTRA